MVSPAVRRRLRLGTARLVSWLAGVTPPGFGQARLVSPIYRHWFAHDGPFLARARLRGGAKVELDLQDRIQGMTFLIREYDPALIAFLTSRLPSGGVFVDVGAHVGLISLSVAARCRRSGVQVHAFEPNPVNSNAFRINLELNPGLDVLLNELAVGARRGTATLRPVSDRERGCAQIVDPSSANDGDDVQVETVSLSSYLDSREIQQVDVLKIDAEGYEPQVLKGAEPIFREGGVRWVICEINDERLRSRGTSRKQLYELMYRHGYRIAPIPQAGLRRIFPRSPESLPNEDVAFYLAREREELSR